MDFIRKIVVFFSWQSDIPRNHSLIKSGLEKACKKLSTQLGCQVIYDESLRGVPGSPRIEDVVIRKIQECDVFVADLTHVIALGDKQMPNSNVIYELGRAEEKHVSQQIVKLVDKKKSDVGKSPFDVSHSAIIPIDIEDKDVFYNLIKDSVKYVLESPNTIFLHNDSLLYSDNQVQKNIRSGKYLPDVFLERQDLKEHLRYFVDPFLFSTYVVDKVNRLNFDRLNRGRRLWGKQKFKFKTSQFKVDNSVSTFSQLYNDIETLRDYVEERGKSLSTHSNEEYFNLSKCGRRAKDLEFLTKKVCLLTGNAGQGKTNFICDFTQNVLLKRHIPFIYLNGYEIASSDIEKTFVKALCPTLGLTFEKVMSELNLYCSSKRKPFVLIIDGLNENPHPDEFCRTLVDFMNRMISYDFVKTILTCRSEYLKENFADLKINLENELLLEYNIYEHIQVDNQDQLLDNYFKYFKIKVILTDNVTTKLVRNLLLLRIFCEANKGKNLGSINHINQDSLFSRYYTTMLDRVAEAHDWVERKFLRTNKIRKFFAMIIQSMIENETFFNVPLDDLMAKFEESDENMFLRFLDENILLRKDLTETQKPFGNTEVVNFTYDTFRDYLVARYIIDSFGGNVSEQKHLISKYTSDGHQLKEGIVPYIFVHTKNSENYKILKFLQEQTWYVGTFEKYIWDVCEDKVCDDDIVLMKERLLLNPKVLTKKLLFFSRWNTEVHPKLNIKILLDVVMELDDENLSIWIEKVWNSNTLNNYWLQENASERKKMISFFKQLLDDDKFFEYNDSQLVFEFLAYFAVVKEDIAQNIYELYIKRTGNIEQVRRIESNTKSKKLKEWMNKIIAQR